METNDPRAAVRKLVEKANAAIGALGALRRVGTLAEDVSRADALRLAEDAEQGLRKALTELRQRDAPPGCGWRANSGPNGAN